MSYLSPISKNYSPNPYSSPSRENNLTQMEGYLFTKQGVSMIWKQYYVQASSSVFIAFEEKEDQAAFTLHLNQYQISWHGRLQDKFSFVLKNKRDSIRDIRWLYVGADSELVARNWYHYLLNTVDRSNLRVNGEEGPLGDIPIQAEYSDGWETQRISEERGVKGSFEARTLRELEKSKTPPRYSVGTESLRSPDRSNHFSYSPMRPHQNGNGAPQTDNNGEFALPEEAPEWVEKIFNEHIQNNQMWKDIDRDSNEKWQQIQNNSEKMTLWISKKDARRHRGKFAFKNTSVQKVVKVLLDLDKKKEWEDSLLSTKALFYAPTTKQAIIHEVYKAEGLLQRRRELLYTRYLFQTQNAYFIIEKTLGTESSGGLSKLLHLSSHGKIDYSIIQVIEKNNNSTQLNVLMKLTNGGFLTAGQDSKITLKYLQNMGNIEQILAAIWDIDTLDLLLIPCPENEIESRTQFLEAELYDRNQFNPNEDRYWRERPVQGEKEKVRSYKIEKVEDIPQTKMSSRYREPLDLDNGTLFEEENLRDEDINEKILTVARPQNKSRNVLSINLSGEETKVGEKLSRRTEPKYDENYVPISYEDTVEALKVLLERLKKGDHTLECINKRIKVKELTRDQKEAKILDVNGDFMCGHSWKRDPNGGLEFIDKDIIDRQRQVVMWLLRSAGRLIMEGKSLVNMSLPIIISGKETTLHRAAMNCAYAPVYLPIAGDQRDPLEAFKWVLTYFFASHHVGINQEKPFNPILGETYQGFLGGIPVDCEQISHHPPISSVYMKTDKFVVQSNFRLEVVLGGPNSAKGLLLGNICIKLPKSDSQVYGLYPPAISSGTTMGKRLFYYIDKLRAYDPKHNFYAEILFNPDDKGAVANLFSRKTVEVDKAIGTIYQLKPEAMKEFTDKKPKGDTKWNFNPKEHSIQELAKIEGKWTKFFKIDGKVFWKDDDVRPCLLIDKPNKPLPSDCRFREDLIYRKMEDFENGQIAKEKMEDLQRADRKGRVAHREALWE